MGDKARKRVWTQDVELALGQQQRCSLSGRRAAKTQEDPRWCLLTQPASKDKARQLGQLATAASSRLQGRTIQAIRHLITAPEVERRP